MKRVKRNKEELVLVSDATIEVSCRVLSVLGSFYVRGAVEANMFSLRIASLSPLVVVLWCDSAMQRAAVTEKRGLQRESRAVQPPGK